MEDGTFEVLFHSVAVGLVLLDSEGQPLALNEACRELLGAQAEDVVRNAVAARMLESASAEGPVPVGIGFGVLGRLSRLRPDDGEAPRYVLVVGRAIGVKDSVTGLETRETGYERLKQLLSRRKPVHVELVFVDLDGFKEVNDRLGHQAGDEVLTGVAERLVSVVRPEDIVTRWGGDEFVVILEDPSEGSAQQVCARVAQALEKPVATSEGPVLVSASCGCAVGTNGDDAATLLHAADQRMYAVKRTRSSTSRPIHE